MYISPLTRRWRRVVPYFDHGRASAVHGKTGTTQEPNTPLLLLVVPGGHEVNWTLPVRPVLRTSGNLFFLVGGVGKNGEGAEGGGTTTTATTTQPA